MRTWITLALLISAALAGCAGDETPTTDTGGPGSDSGDGQNETATQTSSTTAPSGGDNGTQDPAPNTPPTANLTADAVNGTAPLNVTFALEGSDADGDDISWSLAVFSANGTGNQTEIANGTSLPASGAYNFTEAGNFTVVLAVSDGTATTLANMSLQVTGGQALPTPEDQHFTGTITGVWAPEAGYVEGSADHTYDLPSQPATMTVHLAWARTGGGMDIDVYIYGPDGNEVAAGNNFNDPALGNDQEQEIVVIDDPGALSMTGTWTYSVISASSVATDYTLDVTFT